MLLIAETKDPNIIKALALKILEKNGQTPLIDPEETDFLDKYIPGEGVDVIYSAYGDANDTATARYVELYLASLGARYWGTALDENSPIYAGDLALDEDQLDRALIDATYAENRAVLFHTFGVKYVGPTFIDPKHILVLGNKAGIHTHSPVKNEHIRNLLTPLPVDWWKTLGIVSAGNINKLVNFMDHLDFALPLTYTDSGRSKLKYLKREFAEIDTPRNDKAYGLHVREQANRLSYRLSLQ